MNIQPIRLLNGTHHDTESTGRGCFMNVVSYLTGELITDAPSCVCPSVREVIIAFNDELDDCNRNELLLPFLERALIPTNMYAHSVRQRVDWALWLQRELIAVMPANDYVKSNSGSRLFASYLMNLQHKAASFSTWSEYIVAQHTFLAGIGHNAATILKMRSCGIAQATRASSAR